MVANNVSASNDSFCGIFRTWNMSIKKSVQMLTEYYKSLALWQMAIFIANVLYKKKKIFTFKVQVFEKFCQLTLKQDWLPLRRGLAVWYWSNTPSPKGLQLQQQVTPCTETDATLSIDVHEKQSTYLEPCHFKQLNKIDLTWTHDL